MEESGNQKSREESGDQKSRRPPPLDPRFEALIRYIQESRGIDFRGYKRTSLRRRIGIRMHELGIEDSDRYQSALEADPQEFNTLLNTVLINVTSFFRDKEAWDVLRQDVVPAIIERRAPNSDIRIWSVGCASGQEPYSVAMLFADAFGAKEFCRRCKVYATDLDEDALSVARHATYSPRDVEGVPPDMLERYFERTNNHYVFQRELRKCVIFGRHDVVRDAPISRIDLLLCRNLLIYLETETQNSVLPRLHYALTERGFLFLGKAETQLARSRLFEPLDPKHRIFVKVAQEWRRTPGGSLAAGENGVTNGGISLFRLLEGIFDAAPVAYLAVDAKGKLAFANTAARRLLAVGGADIGRPFQDLSVSYRPAELRSCIEDATRNQRSVRLEDQVYDAGSGEPVRLTIEVTPVIARDGQAFATLLSFADTSRTFQLRRELEAVHESLETTVEELQSANEELETTNEELQSTNEELETTNEELQSTNEELETMNEELQSTNEELEASNEELRRQSDEASERREHLESILGGVSSGVVVLDSDCRVQTWNRWNENLWGLRAEEATGRDFFSLDIGLPVPRLREAVDRVLDGDASNADETLSGIDRRGHHVRCRVRVAALRRHAQEPLSAVLFIDDLTEAGREDAMAQYIGRVLGDSLNEIYFLDPVSLRFQLVNRGAEAKLRYRMTELRRLSLSDLVSGVPEGALRHLIAPVLDGRKREAVFETLLRRSDGSTYPAEMCIQFFADEEPPILVALVHDTTERQQLQTAEAAEGNGDGNGEGDGEGS